MADTPTFDTAAIVSVVGGRARGRGRAGPITANSTTMAQGEWFVALAGDGFDDHEAVPEAARRRLAGVVVERAFPELAVPQVIVPDTWRALRQLASAARDGFTGPVVGITGSVGKTTTRSLTVAAMGPLGPVHHTRANHNGQPGLSLTLLECPTSARAQVLEIGTDEPGVIAREAALVRPTVRVVTRVAAAHLDRLGDLDGVAREKGALLDTARPGDVVIVAVGDRAAAHAVPAGVERLTVGQGGTIALASCTERGDALLATYATPVGPVEAVVPTTARFVAKNARFALAVAWALGVDLHQAAGRLAQVPRVGRRLRPVSAHGGIVIDDTFNASPRSVVAAVEWLASRPGKRLAVLGDMACLGDHTRRHHDEVVAAVDAAELDDVLLLGPQLRRAARGRWSTADHHDDAADWLRARLGPGVVALVKGSRAMALDRVVDAVSKG